MFDRLKNYINDEAWKINISRNQVDIVNYLDIILLEEEKILLQQFDKLTKKNKKLVCEIISALSIY